MPVDQEQHFLLEDLYKSVEKMEETQEMNMTNKVNIEFLRDQLDKALKDIEELKDKVRAGTMGLPLMVAIIGGNTHRFRPLVDIYRQAGKEAGHPPEKLTVGLHSLGYVANSMDEAIELYYEGYAKMFTKIGKERGWGPVTREQFNHLIGPLGAIVLGNSDQVAEKILRHSEALGGISRFQFQMDIADITHENLIKSIELIGKEVIPKVNSVNSK